MSALLAIVLWIFLGCDARIQITYPVKPSSARAHHAAAALMASLGLGHGPSCDWLP